MHFDFDAVVFDMDGLMFDTEAIYSRTSRRAADELGFPFDEAFYRARFTGRRLVDSEAELIAHFGEGFPLRRYRELSIAYLRAELERGAPQKPGLLALLAALEEHRIPIGVATSTERDLALLTLGPLARRFAHVTTGDEVTQGKPAPDIFLLACARLRAEPARCVVLEDSSAGIRAAHAAGAIPIWVPDLQIPDAQTRALAAAVCQSLVDVKTLLAV
jgi:HAD superfamily hydrolase (TIGR01509 family)